MTETDKTKEDTFEKIASPHDRVIKDFLSEKETAKSIFREHLPPKITKHLDFRTLKISKNTFVDVKLKEYFSDLLYEVKLKGRAAFIYLLIEHKSTAEFLTGLQILKYMVRIWELYLKQHNEDKILPVILPFVIYHGSTKWKIDTHFISLFEAPDFVKEYIPDFTYHLEDISHLPDEDIKGAVLSRILLLTMKYILFPELRSKLPGILKLFLELEDKRKGTEYLEALLRYISAGARYLNVDELKESVSQVFDQGGDIMATIAEKWFNEGKEEAIWSVIKNALSEGLPMKTIEKLTGLPAKKINQLKKKMAETAASN